MTVGLGQGQQKEEEENTLRTLSETMRTGRDVVGRTEGMKGSMERKKCIKT